MDTKEEKRRKNVSRQRIRITACVRRRCKPQYFHFWVLLPVARIIKNRPSQQLLKVFIYILLPLHVSALVGHLQAEYTTISGSYFTYNGSFVLSKSKSCYDRRSVSQYVVVSSSLWNPWPDITFCLQVAVLSLWGALSDERSGLSPVSHFHQCLVHYQRFNIPYILESNPHPNLIRTFFFATFLNEKKLVRASNLHLSFNRPLPTGRLFE
jgi:hypothetical protein